MSAGRVSCGLVVSIVLWLASPGVAWAWTDLGGGDHGGANWTPANGTVISGVHTNVGIFTVSGGTTVYVAAYGNASAATPGYVEVRAVTINVSGTLDAQGRGYGGGGGGSNDSGNTPGGFGGAAGSGGNGGAGYWGWYTIQFGGGGGGGGPDGTGGASVGGTAGSAGTSSAGGTGGTSQGGSAGGPGGTGYGGGGGGGGGFSAAGGGGGGGGTGGVNAPSNTGGAGGGSFPGAGGAGTADATSTDGGNGGYAVGGGNGDISTDTSLLMGSGGGGGGSTSSGGSGGGAGGGGAGGGAIYLKATGNITVSGAITCAGAGGGQHGSPTFTGNYGGGGAGGGLLLWASGSVSGAGSIDLRGYNLNTATTVNGGTVKIFDSDGVSGLSGSIQTGRTYVALSSGWTFNNTSTGQNGTIQNWTAPATATYRIEVWGAQGGGANNFGKGARMRGDFALTSGTQLKILVGQQGGYFTSGSGGGGSFVTYTNNTPLIVAGGGGGQYSTTSALYNADAVTGTSGQGTPFSTGGAGGGGGTASSNNGAAGGGGITGDGGTGSWGTGGLSFVNGGTGGNSSWDPACVGGFGGGGGTHGNTGGGGAGGGYSGGGGGYHSEGDGAGGGGGSYNAGTNQSNSAGVKTGHGQVVITQLSGSPPTVTLVSPADGAFLATNGTYSWQWSVTGGGGSGTQIYNLPWTSFAGWGNDACGTIDRGTSSAATVDTGGWTDTLPGGSVVTNIQVRMRSVYDGGSSTSIAVNGTLIGTMVPDGGTTCDNNSYMSVNAAPGTYTIGGWNAITLTNNNATWNIWDRDDPGFGYVEVTVTYTSTSSQIYNLPSTSFAGWQDDACGTIDRGSPTASQVDTGGWTDTLPGGSVVTNIQVRMRSVYDAGSSTSIRVNGTLIGTMNPDGGAGCDNNSYMSVNGVPSVYNVGAWNTITLTNNNATWNIWDRDDPGFGYVEVTVSYSPGQVYNLPWTSFAGWGNDACGTVDRGTSTAATVDTGGWTDTLPGGSTVTNIRVRMRSVYDAGSSTSIAVNGTLIGTMVPDGGTTCDNNSYMSVNAAPGTYNIGAWNAITLTNNSATWNIWDRDDPGFGYVEVAVTVPSASLTIEGTVYPGVTSPYSANTGSSNPGTGSYSWSVTASNAYGSDTDTRNYIRNRNLTSTTAYQTDAETTPSVGSAYFYNLSMTAGRRYIFATCNHDHGQGAPGGAQDFDTRIIVYDSAWTQVANNDDCGLGGLGSYIDYNCTSSGTYYVRLGHYTDSGAGSYTLAYKYYLPGTPGLWTGNTSSDWFTTTNWDDGNIPAAGVNVTIPAGRPNYPDISAGTANCYNLTVNAGGTLTVSGGALNVTSVVDTYEGINNYGGISFSGGTVTVSSSVEQYGGTLTISGSASLAVSWYLYNIYGYNSTINMSGGTVTCNNIPNYQGTINHSGGTIYDNGYYFEQYSDGGVYYGTGTALIVFQGATSDMIDIDRDETYFQNVTIATSRSLYEYGAGYNGIFPFDINGNLTISGGATLTASSSSYNIEIAGNWTNGGSFSNGSDTVTFDGAAAAAIGGTSTTGFYNLTVNKGAFATTVTQNAAATVGATLNIQQGTFVTNGYGLSVSGTTTSTGSVNGKLDITVGGTVNLAAINQYNALKYLAISGTPTVNISGTHDLTNAGHRCDISGGTVNYTSTGTNLTLQTNNPGWGWFATGGTISFSGTLFGSTWINFQASGSAIVKLVGASNATITLQSDSYSSPNNWYFNDLRIEKTGGASVTAQTDGVYVLQSSVTAAVGITVNAGAVFNMGGAFDTALGWDITAFSNSGTTTQNAARLYVSGSWTNNSVFNCGTNTVAFAGTSGAASTIGGTVETLFYILEVTRTAGSLTLGRNIIVNSPGGGYLDTDAAGNVGIQPGAFEISFTGVSTGSQVYSYTGSFETWVVPAGVTSITVDAYGAEGGYSYPGAHTPGKGGRTQATLTVTPGTTLYIYVGGKGSDGVSGSGGVGGWNGGGTGGFNGASYAGGGGGGASDIRSGGMTLASRILVAGGGGGSAHNYGSGDNGGYGGGLTAGNGYSGGSYVPGQCGDGGTQASGGAAGQYPGWPAGTAGVAGTGGSGAATTSGGGGGGGYFGGGGGSWTGAGGGSSYVTASGSSGITHTQNVRSAHGEVTISW